MVTTTFHKEGGLGLQN